MKLLPHSFKNTLLLAVALLVTATGLSISQLVTHRYSLSLLDGAAARAENMAHRMALDAADKVLINDLVSLQKMLEDQIASDPSVAYLFVMREGRVIAHTFSGGIPVHLIGANPVGPDMTMHIEKIVSQEGERYVDVAYPIFGGKAGFLRLGIAEAPYRAQTRRLWMQMSAVTFSILLLALVVVHWVIDRLTRPLHQLAKSAEQIDAGNLNTQVAVRGRHEVARVATAFNSMLMRIEDYTTQLKHYNERLEKTHKELDRTHKQLKISFSISQKIAALPKLEQICRFLIQTLKEVVSCRDISLLVLSRTSRTVNLATPTQTHHLDQEGYQRLHDQISRYEQLAILRQPDAAKLQLPGTLGAAGQVALFPIR